MSKRLRPIVAVSQWQLISMRILANLSNCRKVKVRTSIPFEITMVSRKKIQFERPWLSQLRPPKFEIHHTLKVDNRGYTTNSAFRPFCWVQGGLILRPYLQIASLHLKKMFYQGKRRVCVKRTFRFHVKLFRRPSAKAVKSSCRTQNSRILFGVVLCLTRQEARLPI